MLTEWRNWKKEMRHKLRVEEHNLCHKSKLSKISWTKNSCWLDSQIIQRELPLIKIPWSLRNLKSLPLTSESPNSNKEEQLLLCNLRWGKSSNSNSRTLQLLSIISWMLLAVPVKTLIKTNHLKEDLNLQFSIKTNLTLPSIKDHLSNKCQMLDKAKM